jgi:hypothetical protein
MSERREGPHAVTDNDARELHTASPCTCLRWTFAAGTAIFTCRIACGDALPRLAMLLPSRWARTTRGVSFLFVSLAQPPKTSEVT